MGFRHVQVLHSESVIVDHRPRGVVALAWAPLEPRSDLSDAQGRVNKAHETAHRGVPAVTGSVGDPYAQLWAYRS